MDDKSALIMVTHNNFNTLIKAITSIYLYTNHDIYDLYIIDNNSHDKTKNLDTYGLTNTKVIRSDENLYWAGGINLGLDYIKDKNYEYIFFLNDNIEVYDNWLEKHTDVLKTNEKIGAVGPLNSSIRDWQCYNRVRKDFKLENTLPRIDNLLDIDIINDKIHSISPSFVHIKGMLAFFCVAFRHEVIHKVGKLDERFIMGGDDDAYCRELEKKGY
ncbi:MAG: glycosyltransferase family 2 protein, partial [Spirochaetota bacterium]